jgi:hypothetical protein
VPPRYDTLHTLAFRLREANPLAAELWTLRFPEAWKRPLVGLQAEHLGRPAESTTIPMWLLNAALRASVPDVLSIGRGAGRLGEALWITSARKVPPQFLDPIIREWVRVSFPRASDASRQRVLADIRPENLRWEPEWIDPATWRAGENGTTVPARQDAFTLLPDFLAARLAIPGMWYELGDSRKCFYRALGDPWTSSAEVISWPPFTYRKRRGDWPFSMVLRFTVQTIAFDPQPIVHCEVMLRRWASLSMRRMPPGNTSVFLRGRVPWIAEATQTQSATFQVAPICWKPNAIKVDGGKTRGGYTWGSNLAPLLKALAPRLDLPDPEALCADPARYLNPHDLPNVAIDFRNGMLPEHAVGPGWGPADRRDITSQVAHVLGDVLTPREALPKVTVPLAAPTRTTYLAGVPKQPVTEPTTGQLTLRTAIRRALPTLTVDLLYQSDEMRDGMVAHVVDKLLGLPPLPIGPPGTELRWDTPEGFSLVLRPRPLGGLGAGLQLPTGGNLDDRLRIAIRRRCQEVSVQLGGAEGAAGAMIEIGRPEQYEPHADPKFALRLGAAQQGRLSQYLLVDDGDGHSRRDHRIAQAWSDLLRQLGVQLTRPAFASRAWAIPEPLNYVGIWLIKQSRPTARTGYPQQIPVMVWMASDSDEVRAFAPGFPEWLPYGQALLALARLDLFERRGRNEGQAMQFIQQTLLQHVLSLGNVLLLTDAQNLRGTWKWLQNGHLDPDHIQLGVAPPVPIDRWPGVRHVQVRTADAGETPECFGAQPDTQGFPKGLWRMSERVFASTSGKPATQQHMLGNLSKLHPWRSANREYPPKPDAHVWNPSLVEFTVAAKQPSDDPALWAAVAHGLRFMASHYQDALVHPLPLHLADQMEEYVLPMQDNGDAES